MDINRADERKKQILQPGDRIVTAGREIYTILPGEVGIGGSGVVYPAQREGSDLQYVLKESFPAAGYTAQGVTWARQNGAVQPVSCASEQAAVLLEQARAAFQREKEISQQVSNNTGHTVQILDLPAVAEITTGGVCYRAAAGDFEPGMPLFLVMTQQHSRGLFLDEILIDCMQQPTAGGRKYPLRTGDLPSTYTVIQILKEILQAIGAVHHASYLHGDIQNRNIFFLDANLTYGELGHGCLLDFGTARKLEPDGLTAPVGDSMVYTTSGYAAPELWDLQGGARRLSPATDLYSAGRLLHWMLTGQIYTGSKEQMFYFTPFLHIVQHAVQCPSEALELINQLLRRLLSNDPASRYQSAEELLYGQDAPSVQQILALLCSAKNRLGLDLSPLAQGAFVGRRAECKQIGDLLAAGQKPVILWGFGGLGKTELAIEYGRQYRAAGQGNVFFVRFAGSFLNTLTGPVADAFSDYDKRDHNTHALKGQNQVLHDVLGLLGQYGPNDLLIIDNVDQPDQDFDHLTAEESYKKLLALPIRLMLTTRTEQEGQVQVGTLSKEELRTVMRQFCKAPDEALDALIDAVNGHTLAVELMARMLKADRRMTADTLLARLNTPGGLNREKDVRISSSKDRTRAGTGEKERIYQHLQILFDCSGLSEMERQLLRHTFLIPDVGMDSALFLDCEPEDAAESLDKLITLGWIQESQGEIRLLTMHPLVREVIWNEMYPDGTNCKSFLDALYSHHTPDQANVRRLEQLAEAFLRAARFLPIDQAQQNFLWNESGFLFSELGDAAASAGNLDKEFDFYQKSLSIHQKHLPSDHPHLIKDYQKFQTAAAVWQEQGLRTTEVEAPSEDFYVEELLPPPQGFGFDVEGLLPPPQSFGFDETIEDNDVVCYDNLGGIFPYDGQLSLRQNAPEAPAKALAFYQKTMRLLESTLPPDHPDLAASYNNIGSLWGVLEDHHKELEFLQKALAIREKILPPDHPDLAVSYNNVGAAWGALGDFQKELQFFQKALIIREKILPLDHLDLAVSYNNVGAAWGALGDFQKELEYNQKALAILEKVLPPDHPNLAASYNNIGAAWGALGNYQKELQFFQKALAILEKVLPSDHPHLADSYDNIGTAWGALGNDQKETEFFQKAFDIREKALSPHHPYLADSHWDETEDF